MEIVSTRDGGEMTALADQLGNLGQINKAASDELRLQILQVLKADSFGVLELCGLFDLAQPKLSHHLKVLNNAGLVATRREGNSIFYRRSMVLGDEPMSRHVAQLFSTLDALKLDARLVRRIDAIKRGREQQSIEFFAKYSGKFTEHQALIAERNQYSPNLLELIDALRLDEGAQIVEVGPGEGELLCELAQRFSKVVGIDNSSAMLDLARENATSRDLKHLRLIEADATQPAEIDVQGDLVICDMVLHHLASPSAAITRLAELVRAKGCLLIADLGPHNQEWVKESCGDLWLGFATDDLMHWAELAGLTTLQSAFLSLRNGFQVQLHLFQKHHTPTLN